MDKAPSDLIEWYKLETEFLQDHVRHTRYLAEANNRNERVKEDWSNCGELGRGGFGVVYKQVEKNTGWYRAMKAIDQRPPLRLDYSRELLVMAILAKFTTPTRFDCCGLIVGCVSARRYSLSSRDGSRSPRLYIAMEYLKEGDLSKHIGLPLLQETVQRISTQILEGLKVMHQQGIAHRDLKPENIFVVSKSPVWVKLGDFGVSKRILAQGATTLHTPVSTQTYSAPEVLGLDSNSETSDYTNSVDIWSLGCVIYGLITGTKLFALEGQVSRYYFGKLPFPEDKLKGLSPPTDDIGISLLKSMLLIQPEDRPTAAAALSHEWLVGIHSDGEDNCQDRDRVTQGRDESTRSRKRKNSLAKHNRLKKRRCKRNQTAQADTICILGGAALDADIGSQSVGDLNPQKTVIDTSVRTPSPADAASVKSSGVETERRKSELMPYNFEVANSEGSNALRKTKICYISPACAQDLPQAARQRPIPTVEIVFNPLGGPIGQLNTCERKRTKLPPSPQPLPVTELYRELHPGEPTLPGRAGSDATVWSIQRTNSNTTSMGEGSNQNGTTINSIRNPNTRRNINRRQGQNIKQTPNAGTNPNTGGNPGWNYNC
ncbi:kinase-like domain-containing protein [Tuber borchii]|uniref:non-specific serine/threonine protein kinase n=1 Tax=Tuber borchii TaxID=42251 RepID=A0A2T6ZU78_TUBBO|nr:kinase-like domain-containing protein [Tuber borchii]